MKKIIYILLVSCVLSASFFSCKDEMEEVFDETASQRKTEAVEQFQKTLKSSENGWIFQYYPSEDQKYGGYNYVVKFNDNDSASVWIELSSNPETYIESFYDVVSSGGPVLTFNTYNVFMHYFSTPSSSEYNAKGGDFDFLMISEEDDIINLKGTKTGNLMRLIKLNESPVSYLSEVKENSDFINSGSYSASINETEIEVTRNGRNLIFTYEEEGERATLTVPYIVTKTGISFYEEVEILGASLLDFTLDIENKKLSSNNGDMIIEIILPPIDLNQAAWFLDLSIEGNGSNTIISTFIDVYNANVSVWNEQLSARMVIGEASATYGDYGISFNSYPGPYRAHYNLSFNGVKGHSDYIDIVKISAGFQWNWYTHLLPMVDVIADNSPFLAEIDDLDNPTQVKLTSVSNPDVWFILTK